MCIRDSCILGKEWRLTHDFKPTEYFDHFGGSLHLTIGGPSGDPGDRTPAIWPFNQTSGNMIISSAVNGNKDYEKYFVQPPVGVWTTIAISQTLEGNKYIYRISIGGEEVHAVENRQAQEFQDVQVFGSDPWHPAQPGSIRNLVIETRLWT